MCAQSVMESSKMQSRPAVDTGSVLRVLKKSLTQSQYNSYIITKLSTPFIILLLFNIIGIKEHCIVQDLTVERSLLMNMENQYDN